MLVHDIGRRRARPHAALDRVRQRAARVNALDLVPDQVRTKGADRRLVAVLLRVLQQVEDPLILHLDQARAERILDAADLLLFDGCGLTKQLGDSRGHDAIQLRRVLAALGAVHGERLARARLAIRKQQRIAPFERRGDHRRATGDVALVLRALHAQHG